MPSLKEYRSFLWTVKLMLAALAIFFWRDLILIIWYGGILKFIMSAAYGIPIVGEINSIRENYDTSNPVIAEILKAKEERLKILQELNKQYQEEFDICEPLFKNDIKKEKKSTVTRKNKKSELDVSSVSVRRSTRLQNSPNVSKTKFIQTPLKWPNRPTNEYGAIPGVEVGTHWETRLECSYYGVHRPSVAGIHGGPQGAYSIALSGGYPEDVDEGHSFLYTGAGGRDLKGTASKPKNLRTAPQSKDQKLEGTNLSLVKSIESKLPVRVIRGFKSPSIFAPEKGYRYDGLYQVIKYWEDVGETGHRIYRFRMERMKDQAPPPWETNNETNFKRKAIVKEIKSVLSEFSDENDDDNTGFKENITPDDYQPLNSLGRSINSTEVKDVDEEIQMCIDSFCEAAVSNCSKDFQKDSSEEEFHGWD